MATYRFTLHSDGMLRTSQGFYAGPIPARPFSSPEEVREWLADEQNWLSEHDVELTVEPDEEPPRNETECDPIAETRMDAADVGAA